MYKINNYLMGYSLPPWYIKLIPMKLIVLLSLMCFFQATARTTAQNITLKMENATLKQVMSEIQKQTNHDFIYNSSHLNHVRLRYVDYKDKDFKEVLAHCLYPVGLTYAVEKNIVMIRPLKEEVSSQQFSIKGVVRNANLEPIEGATVQLVNGTVAVAADANGSFEMQVPFASGKLMITAVGYDAMEVEFVQGQVLEVI